MLLYLYCFVVFKASYSMHGTNIGKKLFDAYAISRNVETKMGTKALHSNLVAS